MPQFARRYGFTVRLDNDDMSVLDLQPWVVEVRCTPALQKGYVARVYLATKKQTYAAT
jgi:hypothetical protein